MKTWWHHTPIWQRFVFMGLAMILFVLGMHSWVWSSLDQSIELLHGDIARITRETQEVIQKIGALKEIEGDLTLLREKLSPHLQQIPAIVEPQSFRRDVVGIGKRTEVTVRLWNPKQSLMKSEQAESSLDIVVRVEGSFHGTVQFLDEILQLSWIQTINPMVLARKQTPADSSQVMTEFTIHGFPSRML
jgi:Tfp pilus assembly protein PilO